MSGTINRRIMAMLLSFAMIFAMGGFTESSVYAASAKKYVKSMSVAKKASLKVGKSKTLKVTVKTVGGATAKFKAKSSNKAVVTVSGTSKKIKLTGKSAGTAKITVTAKAKNGSGKVVKKTVKVTVKKPVVKVTNIKVSEPEKELITGSTYEIPYVISPANATNQRVSFSSTNPEVASVNDTGIVTAKKAGAADITVTTADGNFTARVTVYVKDPAPKEVKVDGIKVTEKEKELTVGATYDVQYEITPSDATDKRVSFTSSNPESAKVSDTGLVTAMKAGSAEITVTTADGSFTDKVTIYVRDPKPAVADSVSITLTDETLKMYWDTSKNNFVSLVGKTAPINVIAKQDGKPLGNQKVQLTVEPLYGNAPDMYEIKGDEVDSTDDADGSVMFSLSPTSGYTKVSVTDGYFQSYKLTATLLKDATVTSVATISFASIGVESITNVNGIEKEYSPLVPGLNAQRSDMNPVVSVYAKNNVFQQEYVTSQQVSGADVDHSVTFKAYPYLLTPATESEVKKGEYYLPINFDSGSYGTYNDESNTQTTKIIETIPAGLEWANLTFDKMYISKYTKLVVRFYAKDNGEKTDELLREYVRTEKEAEDKTAWSMQIPVQSEREIYAVISLISEGQVDTNNNGGYTLAEIKGAYSGREIVLPSTTVLDGRVKWETDTSFHRATNDDPTLTLEQAKRYIGNSTYLQEGYTYRYNVPAFPHVGNAVITVLDKNGNTKAYFTYPIRNNSNTNVLAPYSWFRYGDAVLIGSNELNDSVGTVTANGNYVTVNSTEQGFTPIKATFDLDDFNVDSIDLDSYSFVQWAPLPKAEEEIVSEDFYALQGQDVEITAQLVGKDGGAVTQENNEISFTYAGGDLADSNLVHADGLNTKTDINGQAKITISAINGTKLLQNLQADSKNYNVRLFVGKEGKLVDAATIHWVDLGLRFVDQVDATEVFDSIDGKYIDVKSSDAALTRPVGSSWEIGLKTLAESEFVPVEDNAYVTTEFSISRVDNVPVTFDNETKVDSFKDNGDGSFSVMNTSVGETKVTGQISEPENSVKPIRFTIQKTVTEEDPDTGKTTVRTSTVGTYENVGVGSSGLTARIALYLNWIEKGVIPEIILPLESTLDSTTACTAFIKVTDEFGNILSGKSVEYTVTNGNDVVRQGTGSTNGYGLVKISINAPGSAVKYKIKAVVEGAYETDTTISYKENTGVDSFAIEKATVDKNANTVTILFNNAVKLSTLKAGMFRVYNSKTTSDYTIESVDKGELSREIVVSLNKGTNLSDVSLTDLRVYVQPYTEENGIEYRLKDTNDQVFSGTVYVTPTAN